MADALTRRRFLELAATGVAAGVAAVLAGCEDTLRGSFGRAAAVNVPTGPRKVAPLASLTATPTPIPFLTADGGETVFAYKDGDKAVVLSSLCTHRGCAVAWDEGRSRFACPCHEGYFDQKGFVLSGPPLGPLTSYPIQLQGGDVYILG